MSTKQRKQPQKSSGEPAEPKSATGRKKRKKSVKTEQKGSSSTILGGILVMSLIVGLASAAVLYFGKGADRTAILYDVSTDVVGRRQILDYGVFEPRPFDGPIPFRIAKAVPVRHVTPEFDTSVLVDAKMPVILKNSLVTKWESMGKWNPEFFRNHVPEYEHVQRVKSFKRCFINYELGADLEDVTPTEFWENMDSREEYQMSLHEFFDLAANRTDDRVWMFAEEVPTRLKKQCTPRSAFKVKGQSWVYFSVWMGEGGTTTANHFDIDDNFYVQFYGRKRFLLMHPKAYKRMKSYPRISPNHKQVQMRRGDPSRYSYILRDYAPLPVAYEAILEPGDVLYIPAYWYHHVEAMVSAPGTSWNSKEIEGMSISANFWSTSHMEVLNSIATPGPFEPGWQGDTKQVRGAFPPGYPKTHLIAAAKTIYMDYLAREMFGAGSLAYIGRLICELRYEDLFGPPDLDSVTCPPPVDRGDAEDILATMQFSGEFFVKNMQTAGAAIQEIEFLNYVELSFSGMIPIKDVYPYLYKCFGEFLQQDPTKIPESLDWF